MSVAQSQPPPVVADPNAALQLVDLTKNFGLTEIIRGVNLSARRGERHAIIGPNGAGKSTLFNLITGRYHPTSGSVILNGQDVTTMPPYKVARLGLSRSFQVTNIFPRMTAFENVRCALLWSMGYKYSFWHIVERQRPLNNAANEALQSVGLGARAQVPAELLSYAEQRALELAVTIASGADVVLLDEPTAGMSASETAHIVRLIKVISEGRTLVMVEHDMKVVFDFADRISVLVYGKIIASGAPKDVRGDPAVREAYLGAAEDDDKTDKTPDASS